MRRGSSSVSYLAFALTKVGPRVEMSRGTRHDLFIIDSADQMAMVTEVQGYRRGARLRKFASGRLARIHRRNVARPV